MNPLSYIKRTKKNINNLTHLSPHPDQLLVDIPARFLLSLLVRTCKPVIDPLSAVILKKYLI